MAAVWGHSASDHYESIELKDVSTLLNIKFYSFPSSEFNAYLKEKEVIFHCSKRRLFQQFWS